VDDPDELRWVGAARAGDRRAFTALVDRYWDRIRAWIVSLTRRHDLAEDLTQDVFVKVWLALPDLKSAEHFRAWVFRIARNLVLDHRRAAPAPGPLPLPAGLPGRSGDPLTFLVEQEGWSLFEAACARLPEGYRSAYLLWVREELPYAEIARILAVTEETARWRVCKARRLLAEELAPFLRAPTQ
jgi:RNA polymerase sigma-70 factor (ECF subfamily)